MDEPYLITLSIQTEALFIAMQSLIRIGRHSFQTFFSLNSLPNDKILDWSKMKAFTDDKINLSEKLKFVLGRVENIVGKGENVGNFFSVIFDPRLGQYSFWKLMIVIATGFIPLTPIAAISTMVKWESSQWLGKQPVAWNIETDLLVTLHQYKL